MNNRYSSPTIEPGSIDIVTFVARGASKIKPEMMQRGHSYIFRQLVPKPVYVDAAVDRLVQIGLKTPHPEEPRKLLRWLPPKESDLIDVVLYPLDTQLKSRVDAEPYTLDRNCGTVYEQTTPGSKGVIQGYIIPQELAEADLMRQDLDATRADAERNKH